jgi:hypothetical protein
MSPRGVYKSYKWALSLYWWSRRIARIGRSKRFPNAGGFIGKKEVIKEISEIIVHYTLGIKPEKYGTLDQDIVRCIYPWFWPRMKVDYYNKIWYRN